MEKIKIKDKVKPAKVKSATANPESAKPVKAKPVKENLAKATLAKAKTIKAKSAKVKPVKAKPKGDNGLAKRMENYQKEWLKIFMVLLEYKAKYGHVDVPARDKFKGVGLGNWVVRQRVIKDKLPKEHRNLLKKAGFNWTPRVGDWDGKFKLLLKFYEKNKHTRVPIDFKKYPELAPWVHKQRRLRVDGKLEDDKISKLNHVHFVWDVSDHLWEIKLNQLVEFHAEHGHFYTPTNKKYVSLSGWRSEQIRVYKSGKLSKDRFERLMEIGFDLTNKSITEVVIAQAENGKFYRVIPQ